MGGALPSATPENVGTAIITTLKKPDAYETHQA
jgi:hypothetical protein